MPIRDILDIREAILFAVTLERVSLGSVARVPVHRVGQTPRGHVPVWTPYIPSDTHLVKHLLAIRTESRFYI